MRALIVILSVLYTSSASSSASSGAAHDLPGGNLRGAEGGRLLQLMPQDTTPRTGVPQCASGYVDSTAGNARYPWRCAATCPGGMWWATHDCLCACVPSQPGNTPPPSGSVTSPPVVYQPLQTTMGYVTMQPSPAPSPYVYEAPKGTTPAPASQATPAPRAVPEAEGGDFPVAAAAAVAGALLVCGVISFFWVCIGPGPEKSVLVAEVPAVTVHAPTNQCPEPTNLVAPPRSSSKTSTCTVSSEQALITSSRKSSRVSCGSQASNPDQGFIPGPRKSSRVSCGSIASQTSNQKNHWEITSATSNSMPPTIVNSTLWAHHVDEGSQSRQLTPERTRASSKMSRVEPEPGSRRGSKSSVKSSR